VSILEESNCDGLDLPSLNMNKATPMTTSSTNKYFFNGYDLRPNSTPRIMTGMGFPDLATTYKKKALEPRCCYNT